MNETPCMKEVRSPALWFCGDLIRPMAETCQGFRPANAKKHPKSPSGTDQKWAKRVD